MSYLTRFLDLAEQQGDDDGSSAQKPAEIVATTSVQGVPAEYAYLEQRFGLMGQDWTVDVRSLGRNDRGRMVETFRLTLRSGAKIDFHFDVTGFYET